MPSEITYTILTRDIPDGGFRYVKATDLIPGDAVLWGEIIHEVTEASEKGATLLGQDIVYIPPLCYIPTLMDYCLLPEALLGCTYCWDSTGEGTPYLCVNLQEGPALAPIGEDAPLILTDSNPKMRIYRIDLGDRNADK